METSLTKPLPNPVNEPTNHKNKNEESQVCNSSNTKTKDNEDTKSPKLFVHINLNTNEKEFIFSNLTKGACIKMIKPLKKMETL